MNVKVVLRIGGHLAHHGVAVGPGDWRHHDQEVASEPRVAAPLVFSRGFRKVALAAGLDADSGSRVVVIDPA